MKRLSDEQSSESPLCGSALPEDEPLDMVDHVSERPREMPKSEGFSFTLIEGHFEGRVWIEVVGRFPLEWEPRYWRAIVQGIPYEVEVLTSQSGMHGPRQVGHFGSDDGDKEQAMFVDDVEAVDQPEPVVLRSGRWALEGPRSLVRLDFFKSVEDIPARNSRVGPDPNPISILVGWRLLRNGELGMGRWLATVEQHELIHQMVEGRTDVVNAVTDKQQPLGVHNGRVIYPQDIPAGLDIRLQAEEVAARVKSGFESLLEIGKVSLRPVDLGFYPDEHVTGCVRCHPGHLNATVVE